MHNVLPHLKCSYRNCTSQFRQMSNFMKHYKKKHLKQCGCCGSQSGDYCFECETTLGLARSRWKLMQNGLKKKNQNAQNSFLAVMNLQRNSTFPKTGFNKNAVKSTQAKDNKRIRKIQTNAEISNTKFLRNRLINITN